MKKIIASIVLSLVFAMIPTVVSAQRGGEGGPAMECGPIIIVGGVDCVLDNSGNIGDSRIYCHYSCSDGTELEWVG